MPPVFVDAHELADRLDVTYDTVLTWARRGKIPHVRDGRGRLLFNLDSVLSTLRHDPHEPRHEATGPAVEL
jgi:excisionase family DNA binding protein